MYFQNYKNNYLKFNKVFCSYCTDDRIYYKVSFKYFSFGVFDRFSKNPNLN